MPPSAFDIPGERKAKSRKPRRYRARVVVPVSLVMEVTFSSKRFVNFDEPDEILQEALRTRAKVVASRIVHEAAMQNKGVLTAPALRRAGAEQVNIHANPGRPAYGAECFIVPHLEPKESDGEETQRRA